MSKGACLLLIPILALTSLILVTVAPALAVVKPSIPDFTVQLVAHPYDVPTTYSVDPYTGENITHAGYHVENKTIDITIKNQPFVWGENYTLYYNVRVKGHFGGNWTELYDAYSDNLPEQSTFTYTVVSCSANYQDGAEIDFQVQAIVGHHYLRYPQRPYLLIPNDPWIEYGVAEMSYWSDTQTLTIGENQTPTPSPEPPLTSDPTFILYIGLALLIVVVAISVVLLIYSKKRKH